VTPQNRRSFLATLGAAALGCATGGAPAAAAAFGSGAPGTRKLDRIGLQLYTVRDAAAKDLPGTLARVAQIGYRDVEFAGYHGRSAQEIRDLLERTGLRAPSSHIPFAELTGNWKKTLDDAKVIGHEYLTIPWLGDAQRGSIEDWKRTASLFNTRAFEAKGAGLKFAYHNHDFEFRTVGGLVPMDVLLAETDPTLVSFEMDLYWVVRAARDPLEYLAKYPNRFSMFHAKDSAGPPDHRMVSVGSGIIDFKHILAEGQRIGVRHVFVEHDNPADAFESIATSYQYLSKLEF
jgi:sugar phosphate isomerase/epimerase